MPFRARWVRQGCHFYFARRVTFQPCADNVCTRNIEMTPLRKLEVTLPEFQGPGIAQSYNARLPPAA